MSNLLDLTKSWLSFSWALSLFGLKQTAGLLDPSKGLGGNPEVPGSLDVATRSVVEQFGESFRRTFQAGDKLQREMVDAVFRVVLPGVSAERGTAAGDTFDSLPIFSARSGAREEVVIDYTHGTARFSEDKRFIVLDMTIYTLDGREHGRHQGVWQRRFEDPRDLLRQPDPPTGPLDQPVGPVPKGPIAADTKAVWAYPDGSIYSVGPAASHLIPLSDGSFLFLVSTAQIITNGTGRFQGAYGLTQSLGATHVPPGLNLFGPGQVTLPATTFHTFKIIIPRRAPSPATPSRTAASSPRAVDECGSGVMATSKKIDVFGSMMNYVEAGQGPTVLFLHGNPTWSYLWRNVIPHVAGKARCIAPDLIGMGLSDKPEIGYRFFDHLKYLDGFVERLGLKDITLVIHDWGSALGFFYAMRHKGNVKGVAAMEALIKPYASWSDFPAPLRPTFQSFRVPDLGYEEIVVKNMFVEELLPRSMIRKLSDAEMNCYRRPFREPISRRVIWRLANDLPIEGRPGDVARAVGAYSQWLKATSLPKLLITATPGAITTEKDVEWCRAHWKNLTVRSIGPGIHFHQEDNPTGVGQEIAHWLETLR